ncbi:MAG: hypothetical protein GXP26_06740 [Planctomycetes bacterium]|nr:hypothetical protein [Planctomycetota bacterium]
MRRKRLKHCADTLCHMFCGWRLVNSYTDIESLGSGTLEIDALSGSSKFADQPTKQLAIAGELRAWLIEDCDTNQIPIDQIHAAKLTATLDFSKTDWKQRKSRDHWFDHKGAEIVWRQINRCVIQCNSIVKTDECEYRSQYQDVEEWPEGFPGTR